MATVPKRKHRTIPMVSMVCGIIFSLILILTGLFETIWVFDNWYFQPNYITDDSGAVFSGVLCIGLAVMIAFPGTHLRSGSAAERCATLLFLFFIVMAPLWSVGVCIVQSHTIARYQNPQFGVCYASGGHGKTYMYVKDSQWCQRFGYPIARPSPATRTP